MTQNLTSNLLKHLSAADTGTSPRLSWDTAPSITNAYRALADKGLVRIGRGGDITVTSDGSQTIQAHNNKPAVRLARMVAALKAARPWVQAAIEGPISVENELVARSALAEIDAALVEVPPK